ncbi:PhzF family phenazine biosynthesis protein [Paenibacillus sp. LHD-117]|uniref:PhzF family phenazine biosynthesis protein n=1 Tax=Paenibacillus sp. LHD-117 TaxID=3071412 RepID=UPI0027E20228|nr:PhzF family phenazine biosynthesis protein [Paenibacillus sp. LHD-117]MDQ6419042.1 PhzF family phenazine biosynthesis protein [Paenibacillus sp. LHD-117]
MSKPMYIVDAFTLKRFGGNPAAVCLVDEPLEDSLMAAIAAEMNLSETAFVMKREEGFGLRWFTPKAEVDLCGHATLAAAHILWETGRLDATKAAVFATRSGQLTASKDGGDRKIVMDFPSEKPEPTKAPQELLEGLGLIPRYVGRNRMDYVVEVDHEDTVRSLQPDFGLLRKLDARGVIVTSRSGDSDEARARRYDFVSRAFYPGVGVDEDPVTGSAHCALAPYWGKRLRRTELIGYQASDRGGEVGMRLQDDRVLLSGSAVTVLRGAIDI